MITTTMSLQSQNNIEGKNSRTTTSKIRKRGCSSSSSSSLAQKYRFKRAILVGKRSGGGGGYSTPVPAWKTSEKSPALAMTVPEQQQSEAPLPLTHKAKEVSVSARKLAATLWEINKIPSLSRYSSNLPPHLSDPSYCPISEKMDRSSGNIARRRRTSMGAHKLQMGDCDVAGALDSVSNAAGGMEVEALSQSKNHNKCLSVTGNKACLKDVSSGLTASKELLKVLHCVWGVEEQQSLGSSLISAMRAEIDRACVQVDQLIKEKQSKTSEIEYLINHFTEEKAAWRRKERERIRVAIACIAEELEVEKKLRRQSERLNKKIGKELAETKACLSNAMKELESETRAKDILEQVCDELARGIGEDRAEVEEVKRESMKVREEVEKEREMLQLADMLREERVQMKLSEAKYHFEEKNGTVERLINELEASLRNKKGEENGDWSPNFERIKELEAYLKKIQFGSRENGATAEAEQELASGEEHEGDDSADSDLHSIELNMENGSRSYKWSYAYDDQDDPKRVSVDKVFKGRKSIEKIQWGSICFGRGSSNIDPSFNEHSGEMGKERLAEILSQTETQDHADDINRYRSIKGLRDHILSGSKMLSLQNFASPTRHWKESLSSLDQSCAGGRKQGDVLRHKVAEARSEQRISTSSRE